ncbi:MULTISPECIES: hypothetical protein [unclassified Bradyrhizobium]|uniref:GAP1-N1 domain-containing protein n=1 Tax=unclassified Bradyrhizobium TaxID=2631580 RepID=UPI0028E36545|nr:MULTISPECIES: hypothetical protein [unclassified Bradyrhizobium]
MLRIDNCLFGYDDGHRLLASSMKLDSESASQLTLLSDLAPGARFGSSDGYWTGFPLPQLDRYALMRTWPAPEMPRPGCVWTHAILIETSLFEDVDDLSRLRELARRPRGPNDSSFYVQAIAPKAMLSAPARLNASAIRTTRAIEILGGLYGSDEGSIAVERPGELDDEIFAIWSQQWPRLRRNFRFQTATSDEASATRSRFDLRLQWRHASNYQLVPFSVKEVPAWLDAAAADLSAASGHQLRRFLWRYGKDVKKQRGSFRPLCETFVSNRQTGGEVADNFVHAISRWFPSKDDALALKQDVVDGELFAERQLDVLSFILKQDKGETFPLPSSEGVGRLSNLWPGQADAMLELAEYAISEDSELAISITGIVLGLIPTSNFWTVTRDFPKVRQRIIQKRPNLLDAEEISELDSSSVAEMIEVVPFDDPVGGALVRRLLHRTDEEMARKVLRRFPTYATAELLSVATTLDNRSLRAWFRALTDEPSLVLVPRTMASVKHSSTLYSLGEALGWLSADVLRAGTDPWLAGLGGATNDLSPDENDVLGSFLIALAMEVGGPGAQILFERFFMPIHDRIMRSYLPPKANDILVERLPNLGWRRNWDTGLRLRVGITYAYIRHHLDVRSFASLSHDKRVRELLAAVAQDLEGGGPYATSISTV